MPPSQQAARRTPAATIGELRSTTPPYWTADLRPEPRRTCRALRTCRTLRALRSGGVSAVSVRVRVRVRALERSGRLGGTLGLLPVTMQRRRERSHDGGAVHLIRGRVSLTVRRAGPCTWSGVG